LGLVLSGILAIGSAAYYRYLGRHARTAPLPFDRLGFPEAVLAGILVLWFLTNLMASPGAEVTVSAQLLIANALLAFFLVTGLVSFLIVRSHSPLTQFGLTRAGLRRSLPVVFPALVMALPAIYFIHALSFHFLGATPQPLLDFLARSAGTSDRLLLIFTAVIVAPISEELIFRGFLYGVFRRYGGRIPALLLSAALFAAIHAHLPAAGGLFVLALALTIVYESTASLWAPILMHALFNALTVMTTLLWPNLMQ